MKILDLFCGAGGCGMGYSRAGFEVVGVDLNPMPRYPFEFHQGDALEYLKAHGHEFDAIHASPPCQCYSTMRHLPNAKPHSDLVAPTRKLLQASGKPWVIENVVGAPLINPTMLCGTMFGLGTGGADLRRHRLFETNWNLVLPFGMHCRHGRRTGNSEPDTIGIYGTDGRGRSVAAMVADQKARTICVIGHRGIAEDRAARHKRDKMRRPASVGVWGNAGGTSHRDGLIYFSTTERNEAMGIDWMKGGEISQAIPPAYTEFIGRQLLALLHQDGGPMFAKPKDAVMF